MSNNEPTHKTRDDGERLVREQVEDGRIKRDDLGNLNLHLAQFN